MKKIFLIENRCVFLNSLFCTLLILTPFFYFQHFQSPNFNDRIIGNIVLNNSNNISFINFLYLTLFIVFPCLFFISYKILEKLYKNCTIDTCDFNGKISFFGLISYFFGFFSFLSKQNKFSSLFLAFILCAITILNIILSQRNKTLKDKYNELFSFSTLISIPFSILVSLVIHKINLVNFNNHIIFIIIYILCIFVSFYLIRKLNFYKLTKSFTIFLTSLIIHPLYIELYNILNQYNIIIEHKFLILILIYVTLFLATICYYKYFINESKEKILNYKKYYFVIIIVGLSLLCATNNLVNIVDTDFFESANHGMSIYELFKYGKIPIIENFDAHLFSNQICGILYGIINHDLLGSLFLIYGSYKYVIFYLVIYFLLIHFIDRSYAFLSVLVIPFVKDVALYDMFFCITSILIFLYAINKKTFKSYLIFWLSLAINCILRLDRGFSISLACVVLLIYLLFINHKKNYIKYNIKSLFSSLILIILLFLGFYISVCLIKNINPLSRLTEFLSICFSNANWAYSNSGNSATYTYYLYYYILPIFVVITLFYLLVTKYNKYDNKCLILILLALYYVFNFERGLIRHSLVENNLTNILGYTLIYFSLFVYYTKKKNQTTSICIYIILLIISSFSTNQFFSNYNSLTIEAANKELSYVLEDQFSNKKVQRVILSDNMVLHFRDLGKVLDLLLKDNETYLDFSNKTLLYALLGYEKPVYVNQSPGLLSGEYSQQQFINEIKNFKYGVPVAIKLNNASLDSVPNDFRYYLISEYIYNNYVLLTNVNDYEIWVKHSYYKKAKEILNKNNISICNDTNIKYHNNEKINLSYIPYIWGKENINTKIIENLKVKTNNNTISYINIKKDNIDKTSGNYLILNIENPFEDAYVTMNIMNKNSIVDKIEFRISKGVAVYKIRISALYSWYFNNVNRFELVSNSKIKIKNAYISKGDTLKNST